MREGRSGGIRRCIGAPGLSYTECLNRQPSPTRIIYHYLLHLSKYKNHLKLQFFRIFFLII